ncbi:hypothetical protein ACL02U_09445 [Streptomyces sp. MS06]|uniref:hypothetical protein n=1 Tax=Streptomyces sp. MS06 TaxID=3385974 RepID=UPI0039A0200A
MAVLALAACEGGDDTGARSVTAAGTTAPPVTAPASPADSAPAPEPSATSAEPAPEPAVATLDDLTGGTVGKAVAAARDSHLAYAVYLQGTGASLDGGGRRASSWGSGERVCAQIDDPEDVNDAYDVAFVIPRDGRDCDGRLLHTPEPTPARTSSTGGSSGGTSGSTGGSKACALTSPAGNCYADGQFCAKRHHGMSTYGKGGEYLTCEPDGSGRWRWSDGHPG